MREKLKFPTLRDTPKPIKLLNNSNVFFVLKIQIVDWLKFIEKKKNLKESKTDILEFNSVLTM